jgi:hypothetical protein
MRQVLGNTLGRAARRRRRRHFGKTSSATGRTTVSTAGAGAGEAGKTKEATQITRRFNEACRADYRL